MANNNQQIDVDTITSTHLSQNENNLVSVVSEMVRLDENIREEQTRRQSMHITYDSSDDDAESTTSDDEYEFDEDEANMEDELSRAKQFVEEEAEESDNESVTDYDDQRSTIDHDDLEEQHMLNLHSDTTIGLINCMQMMRFFLVMRHHFTRAC